MNKRHWAAALLALILLLPLTAARATVTFVGSGSVDGNAVSYRAEFTVTGPSLVIVLTNTSLANPLEAPGSTLSGIFFEGGVGGLTPVSATAPLPIINAAGCTVVPCPGSNVNVGGEWAYAQLVTQHQVGSAGYIPGSATTFGGPNLAGPDSLDGIQLAILSSAHGPLNGGLSSEPLMEDRIVLTLIGFTGTEADIHNVFGVYGTAPEGVVPGIPGPPSVNPIPEPLSLAILGMALLALGGIRARRR